MYSIQWAWTIFFTVMIVCVLTWRTQRMRSATTSESSGLVRTVGPCAQTWWSWRCIPKCLALASQATKPLAKQGNCSLSYQGLCIIFQMDWKCYIITLAKNLQSLHPEVYLEMSDCTVTMVPYGRLVLSLLLWRLVGNILVMFSPNVVYLVEQRVNLLLVFE